MFTRLSLFQKALEVNCNRFNWQQAIDADPKAIQPMNFTGNLAHEGNANTTMFFNIKEEQETMLDFSQGTIRVL